ncbi:hypothetical protein [Actinoplanes aureus]|uniref:Uncharacterized protein n=1 Tax=Actinoplanes aureus TaxID=2792083 RepID=A0A931C9T5_9ACTN|nr:hypothetical protein [Actinoplanes aureus]
MAGSAREEAERLVATILARAATGGLGAAVSGHSSSKPASGTGEADVLGILGESVAGLIGMVSGSGQPGGAQRDEGHQGGGDMSGGQQGGYQSGGHWATGSAECCVCPVCKVIAAMRDPSPETAERLATSAGDIANGVAGLMRAFSGIATQRPRPPAPRETPQPRPTNPDSVWSAATAKDEPAATAQDEPIATAQGEPIATAQGEPTATAQDEPTATAQGEPTATAQDAPTATAPHEVPGTEPTDPWAAASAADARHAAAAARARAVAAEEAVARAVEQARQAAAEAAKQTTRPGGTPDHGGAGFRTGSGSDVWAMATSEAAATDAAAHRSVDHDLGAPAPEDRDAAPGDDARAGDAV